MKSLIMNGENLEGGVSHLFEHITRQDRQKNHGQLHEGSW
jgi:hypothetical protein